MEVADKEKGEEREEVEEKVEHEETDEECAKDEGRWLDLSTGLSNSTIESEEQESVFLFCFSVVNVGLSSTFPFK